MVSKTCYSHFYMKFQIIVFVCMLAQSLFVSTAFAGRMVPNFDSLNARYIPAGDEVAQKRIGVEGVINPRPDIAPALLALNMHVDAIINGNNILRGPNHPLQFVIESQRGHSVCDATALDLVRIRLKSAINYLNQYEHWVNDFLSARSFLNGSVLRYALEALTVWLIQMHDDLRRQYAGLIDGREADLVFEMGEEALQRSLIEANTFFHLVTRRFQYQIMPLVDYLLRGFNTLPEDERLFLLSNMNKPMYIALWELLRGYQTGTHLEHALGAWIPFFHEVQQGLIWRLVQQTLLQEHLYHIFCDLDQNLQATIRQQADLLDEGLGSIYDRVLSQLQRLYKLVRVRSFINCYDDPDFVLRIFELQRLIFQQIEVHLRAFVERAQDGEGGIVHLREQRALELRAEELFQQYFPNVIPYDINQDAFDSEEESGSSGEESSGSMDMDDADDDDVGLNGGEIMFMGNATEPLMGGTPLQVYSPCDVRRICD